MNTIHRTPRKLPPEPPMTKGEKWFLAIGLSVYVAALSLALYLS